MGVTWKMLDDPANGFGYIKLYVTAVTESRRVCGSQVVILFCDRSVLDHGGLWLPFTAYGFRVNYSQEQSPER